jgi:sterol desaturase/sphingolipid hydroxylase (fatty acid hydroxylase superfamily)
MTTHILLVLVTGYFTVWINSIYEWLVHGPLMHGFLGKIFNLQQEHIDHHAHYGQMEGYANTKHGTSVALPTWAALVTLSVMAFVGWIASKLVNDPTDAWIIQLTVITISTLYYTLYQYIHTSMHVPKGRWIEKTMWFKKKNSYHHVHHVVDEKFEQFVNICIVCTWADQLFRTMHKHLIKRRKVSA